MPLSRSPSYNIPDEFPVRPSSMLRNELLRVNSRIERQQTYILVSLCIAYFIYGSGVGLYGPLYPQEAKTRHVTSDFYGPVMAISSVASLLFYPIACKMVASVSCKQSISMSFLMIGSCEILFGVVSLISVKFPFILLSIGIQVVQGVGVALLIASGFVTIFSQATDKTRKNLGILPLFFIFGLVVGPIAGEASGDAYGFGIPFYGAGVLTIFVGIIVVSLLPEPDQRLTFKEIPVLSWIKEPTMKIHFFIVFSTFNYTGFLAIVLEPLLRQFSLNKTFIGVLFSIPPLACGLSAPGWKWIAKKGVNSVLLVCFSSIFIFASLILIGPAPFITIDISLLNVSLALLLNGVGSGGKLACTLSAAYRDMRWMRSMSRICEQLIIPTMFIFGSLLGYFSGSITASFTDLYLGTGKATYVLLALESATVAIAFVFAFQRNYRSTVHPGFHEESQAILET